MRDPLGTGGLGERRPMAAVGGEETGWGPAWAASLPHPRPHYAPRPRPPAALLSPRSTLSARPKPTGAEPAPPSGSWRRPPGGALEGGCRAGAPLGPGAVVRRGGWGAQEAGAGAVRPGWPFGPLGAFTP